MIRHACCVFTVTALATFAVALLLLAPPQLNAEEGQPVVELPRMAVGGCEFTLLTPQATEPGKDVTISVQVRNLREEPVEAMAEFHVHTVQPSSRFSRMMPMPTEIKTDCLPVALGPLESKTLTLTAPTTKNANGQNVYYTIVCGEQAAMSMPSLVADAKTRIQLSKLNGQLQAGALKLAGNDTQLDTPKTIAVNTR
jgi:hypothetical protein